jgi:hypothetical protein
MINIAIGLIVGGILGFIAIVIGRWLSRHTDQYGPSIEEAEQLRQCKPKTGD